MGIFNNIGNDIGRIKNKINVFVEKREAKSLERLEGQAANAVLEEKKLKHKQKLLNSINKTKKLKDKIKKDKSDAFAKKMNGFGNNSSNNGKKHQQMFSSGFKF